MWYTGKVLHIVQQKWAMAGVPDVADHYTGQRPVYNHYDNSSSDPLYTTNRVKRTGKTYTLSFSVSLINSFIFYGHGVLI